MDGLFELEPILEQLQRDHDVLPFLGRDLPACDMWFVQMPDSMVDSIVQMEDFSLPVRGGPPVWLEIEDDHGDEARLIVIRPRSDGELWVLVPAQVSSDSS